MSSKATPLLYKEYYISWKGNLPSLFVSRRALKPLQIMLSFKKKEMNLSHRAVEVRSASDLGTCEVELPSFRKEGCRVTGG